MKLLSDFSTNEVFWLISLGSQAIMFFWLAPLRKAQARLAELEERVEGLNISHLKDTFEAHERENHLTATSLENKITSLTMERRESVKVLHAKIDKLADSVNRGFQDVARSIGQLEGKTEE